MRLSDHQAAFTQDLGRLIWFAGNHPKRRVRLRDVTRDEEWQQMMHERHPGTYAPANRSQHPSSLAADLVLDELVDGRWVYQTQTEAYRYLGERWEQFSLHNRWGGRFARGDGGHFERLEHVREEPALIT